MLTAISTPSRSLWPCAAALPDIGPNAPILMGPRDCAQAAGLRPANAAAPIPAPMNLRRFMVMIVLPLSGACPRYPNIIALAKLLRTRSFRNSCMRCPTRSQIACPHAFVSEQLRAGAAHGDHARFHDVGTVREAQRQVGVLLDQEYGHAGIAKCAYRAHHLLHHQRSQSQRRLVEHEELGLRHHRPAEGEHL